MTVSANWKANSFIAKLREEHRYAFNCLVELIKKGCDPNDLVPLLSILGQKKAHLFADWDKNFGGKNPDDLRQFAKEIEGTAKRIQKFNSTQAGWAAFIAASKDSPLFNIPYLLRKYSATLIALASIGGPKKAFARNEHRRNVVRHVKQATGRYYDNEIAALIAAVEDNPEYSRRAHIRWRHDNMK
jgi:hypothetical protein